MAQIIDGLCDFDNVTADMIARHNMSMYGTSDYVLQIDECLEYDLVSNNEIHVKDGMYIMQGRRGCVKKGTTDICIIENGGQAVNRNDIIVIEYVKDEATRLESHTTKVIKGVPAEVAVDPELVTGDINAGAVLHQMPLYRVKIEGLNVVAVEQMFEIGSVAAETVNPMEATEPGFAADALAVKNQFSEQNKNLTASDNLKFQFATDGEGNYGYLKADDSFVPFKSGGFIGSLKATSSGLTSNTWYSTATIDIKSAYSNYNKITIKNICVQIPTFTTINGATLSLSYTYKPSTGIITIKSTGSGNNALWLPRSVSSFTAKVAIVE